MSFSKYCEIVQSGTIELRLVHSDNGKHELPYQKRDISFRNGTIYESKGAVFDHIILYTSLSRVYRKLMPIPKDNPFLASSPFR